jgi:hypothetical protein
VQRTIGEFNVTGKIYGIFDLDKEYLEKRGLEPFSPQSDIFSVKRIRSKVKRRE